MKIIPEHDNQFYPQSVGNISFIFRINSFFFKKPRLVSDKICGVYSRDDNESYDILW